MGALEAVLQLKAQEQQADQFRSQQINSAANLLQNAFQNAQTNKMAQLQYKAGLAERGLVPDSSTASGFRYDPSTLNPLSQIMTAVQGQAAAKTAGNKDMYDKFGSVIQNLTGNNSKSSQIPQSSPIVPNSPIGNIIGNSQGPNVPITSGNVMTPTGQTSSTDPITGQTTGTTTMTNIPAKVAEANATELGKEQLAGQKAVARDYSTADMLTGMFRSMTDKYATAYKGGLAGGAPQAFLGTQADKGYDIFGFANKDALKAVGGFEAVKNEAITRFNSIYSEQLGGKDASSRIFSTMLDLAQKELPNRANPIPSVQGRVEGSMQNLTRMIGGSINYLEKLHSSQELANATPEQLDKWTSEAMNNSNSYKLNPGVEEGLKKRIDYINQPLNELQSKTQKFTVNGIDYNIPSNKIDAFKKAKGIK